MSTSSAVHRTYTFGEFTLDLDRGALLKAGADIKLRPKSFKMLSYLVKRQGVLVSKDELLDAIWGHTVVTEDAVTHCVTAIQIHPNYHIVQIWMSNILAADLGNYSESFAIDEKLARLDPLSIVPRLNYVGGLIRKNRLADAERELDKIALTNPNFYVMYRGGLTSLGGKWANLLSSTLNALRMTPERTSRWTILTMGFAAIGLEKEALAISENPRPISLRMLGRPAAAVKIAELRLAEDPYSLASRRELGLALASAGDYARACPILEEMWQRGNKTVTHAGLFRADSAAALIAIRRDAGKKAEVGELVAAIRDTVCPDNPYATFWKPAEGTCEQFAAARGN